MATSETEVQILEDGDTAVAVYGDETQTVTEDEAAVFETERGYAFATVDGTYQVKTDEDGWLILDGTEPEHLAEFLRDHESLRFAEADYSGFPVTFKVGYRSDEALYRAAWQEEAIRPGEEVTQEISGEIAEVTLTVEVDADASITVTDIGVWPSSKISFEL